MIHASAPAAPSSHAPHPHAARLQPDPARILTLSSTLALNLLVFGLLLVPVALPPPAVRAPAKPNMAVRDVTKPPEPVVVDIVPVQQPRPALPAPTLERHRVAPPAPDAGATTVTSETGSQPVADAIADPGDIAPPGGDFGPAAGPAPMQLAYRSAPAPAYPRIALQRQWTGTVLLQVLVDVDGRPLDVSIARSSGHRELDEAARQQVLKRWLFQPALRGGAAVQAVGLVPVEFSLTR